MDAQLLTNFLRIGGFFINLVHRNDHRHACCFGMVNRFDGLWHHAVVGCNHQYHDVSGFGTTGTHGGKRFVTWSV